MSILLGTIFQSVRETLIKLLSELREIFYKLILFFLTSTAILWLSVFIYACFYYTYMPSVSHVKPVHFQFETCPNEGGACSYPIANVSLINKGYDQLLMRGQQYRVYLDLEMPESLKNRELGMFMVRIDFKSRTGDIIQTSSRATMLHFKSSLLHTLSTIFFSPLLLFGTLEEKQSISIELFDYYEEDPRQPSTGAGIIIQNLKIEFYAATLRIFAHFTGLRYLMFHWPITSAIAGIGTNLFFLTVVALLSWYRYVVTQKSTQIVVRIGLDDKQGIQRRRLIAKENLMREQQRQELRSRSSSPAPRTLSRSPVKVSFQKSSLENLDAVGKTELEKKKCDSSDQDTKSRSRLTIRRKSQLSELLPANINKENIDSTEENITEEEKCSEEAKKSL